VTAQTATFLAAIIAIATLFAGVLLGVTVLTYDRIRVLTRHATQITDHAGDAVTQIKIMNDHLAHITAAPQLTPPAAESDTRCNSSTRNIVY